MSARTFRSSVDKFVKASSWLGDEHEPALVMLRAMAKELDDGHLSPAMLSQFGLAYRSLAKLAPSGNEAEDPVDALIAQGRGA